MENGAIFFDVEIVRLKSKSRKREIVEARHMIMTAMYDISRISLEKVAHQFNKKDHTTVIHAKQKVRDFCDTDSLYKQRFHEFTQSLN